MLNNASLVGWYTASPQPLCISLMIFICSYFLGICASILKDQSHCWMLPLSSAQLGILGASVILLLSSWAALIFPCSRHRTLLQGKPVFSAVCLALKALCAKKDLNSNQECSHMERTAQKQKSPAKHSSPQGVQDLPPSSRFQHCLESCCTCTSSWDPNGLNRNRKTNSSFRRQNT